MWKVTNRAKHGLKILLAGLSLLQLATCPPQWNQATATIRLSAAGKFFHKITHSRTKLTALTTDDNIVLSPVTGNAGVIVPVPTTLVRTNDALARSIDCWEHIDQCVVCGVGGCYTFEYNASGAYNFLRHFYHRRWFFLNSSNARTLDFVFDVKTLRLTTFFFTIESMRGDESAGLIRWDTSKANCYVRNTQRIQDSNREYYLEIARYTRNVIVSSPGNNALYVYNAIDIGNPVVSSVFGSAATDPQIGKIAAITRLPGRQLLVNCSNRATNTCQVLDYSQTGVPAIRAIMNFQSTTPPQPTPPAVQFIATMPTDYSSLVQINIAPVPQSDWIMISTNDKVHLVLYSIQAVPTTPINIPLAANLNPGTPVNPTPVLTALTSISSLLVSFMTADALLAMGSNVVAMRFTETQTTALAAPGFCHENCQTANTPAAGEGCNISPVAGPGVVAATGHYLSTSCRTNLCNPGATLNGTMTCYLTPTDAVPLGGLFLNFASAGNFTTTNETCANITLFDLTRTVTGAIDEGWRVFWIVFISIGALAVIAAAVILTKLATTASVPKAAGMGYGMSQGYPRSYGYDMNASRSVMY